MYNLSITHDQALALQALITNHKHRCLDLALQALRNNNTLLHDLHADNHKALCEVQNTIDDLLAQGATNEKDYNLRT